MTLVRPVQCVCESVFGIENDFVVSFFLDCVYGSCFLSKIRFTGDERDFFKYINDFLWMKLLTVQ